MRTVYTGGRESTAGVCYIHVCPTFCCGMTTTRNRIGVLGEKAKALVFQLLGYGQLRSLLTTVRPCLDNEFIGVSVEVFAAVVRILRMSNLAKL